MDAHNDGYLDAGERAFIEESWSDDSAPTLTESAERIERLAHQVQRSADLMRAQAAELRFLAWIDSLMTVELPVAPLVDAVVAHGDSDGVRAEAEAAALLGYPVVIGWDMSDQPDFTVIRFGDGSELTVGGWEA
jgi:hypothetical protein